MVAKPAPAPGLQWLAEYNAPPDRQPWASGGTADAPALGAGVARRASSNLASPTNSRSQMVTVSTSPQPGSRVQLEIEVPPDEVSRHFATAYRHVAERTRVPGFRPGKAPRHVIDRFVGRGSVIAEAIDHLVGESYDAALDQTTITPIDQPQVDIDPAAVVEGQGVRYT